MRAEEFDDAVSGLAEGLSASGVSFVLLEDDDSFSVTVVPAPSQRNLERLVRALKRLKASAAAPGMRKIDYHGLVHDGPSRWPIRVAGGNADVLIVDVMDGRWGRYYEASEQQELTGGLKVDVVPDAPILSVRRGAAVDVLPDLDLTQRERDRMRLQRRRSLARAERRDRTFGAAKRLVGRDRG